MKLDFVANILSIDFLPVAFLDIFSSEVSELWRDTEGSEAVIQIWDKILVDI